MITGQDGNWSVHDDGAPRHAANDRRFMALALRLAARGLGIVAPNPAVGCVIVRDSRIVGRGWTQRGGRPHAETEALEVAGGAAYGATAYVTLEPCAHHGQTPPCAEALVTAGISRLVAAMRDPDPRTAGQGLARLSAAGIRTECGLMESAAAALNRGFVTSLTRSRPLVTLKLAASLDGRIASRTGHSRWITGAPARRHVHLLRARHDAILIGRGTLDADDPTLTCRLAGLKDRSPIRIVVSGRGELPDDCRLLSDPTHAPVWLVTGPRGADRHLPDGIEKIVVKETAGRLDMAEMMSALVSRGITRLLVEGGAVTAAICLEAGIVDRFCLYTAPMLIGGDGLAGIADIAVNDLDRDAPRFRHMKTRPLGEDRLDVYEAAESGV